MIWADISSALRFIEEAGVEYIVEEKINAVISKLFLNIEFLLKYIFVN